MSCITGGLAGIKFGFDGIPQRWYDCLLEKNIPDGLLEKLLGIMNNVSVS